MQAYNIVVERVKASEVFLNEEVAIPSLSMIRTVLAHPHKCKNIGRCMQPFAFLARANAIEFFSETPAALAAAAECACECVHSR